MACWTCVSRVGGAAARQTPPFWHGGLEGGRHLVFVTFIKDDKSK